MTEERYAQFKDLLFDRPAPRVLRVTINNPDKMNALHTRLHHQMEKVWGVIDEDPETYVSIITGAGKAFCSGGAVDDMGEAAALDAPQQVSKDFRSASGLIYNIMNSRKPIVSAINGSAVGAGLAIGLLADVPIVSKTAKLFDGHLRVGVVPGDHAAIIWPLLCGMAKAKYFLMTNAPMTGEEAERNNLVAMSVAPEEVMPKAIEVATTLSNVAPTALRMTKHVMNHWLRQAQPIFELSAAFELVNFLGAESKEAVSALMEKRKPDFKTDVLF